MVRVGVAFVVIYFAWHVGPVSVVHRQFKAEVAEATRERGFGPAQELVTAVQSVAKRVGVPFGADDVRVRNDRTYIYLKLTYTKRLQLFQTITYPWTFRVNTRALAIATQPWNGVDL
jgi:xanthine dehydrogenase molybdopterin-binding subunit B